MKKIIMVSWIGLFFAMFLVALANAATVSVNPRGDNQGTVGIASRKWGEGWFCKFGLTDTNRFVTTITTNLLSATHFELATAKAIYDQIQSSLSSVTGIVSSAQTTRWEYAYTWVTNNEGTFGTASTRDYVNAAPPATPGDNGKLPTWYSVKYYVDSQTGTNVVSNQDRANWDSAYNWVYSFTNGADAYMPKVTPYYIYYAWTYADTMYSWWNVTRGEAADYDVLNDLSDTNVTRLAEWQDIKQYVDDNTGTNTVSVTDRAHWDAAWAWVNAESNHFVTIKYKSGGWDDNYLWYNSSYTTLNLVKTWYSTQRGTAANHDQGTGLLELPNMQEVQAYVATQTGTNVVTTEDRANWNYAWKEVSDGEPGGWGIVNGYGYSDWDYAAGWLETNESDIAYVLSRTSVWDAATAPNLDQVTTVGADTTNSITYSLNDFSITCSESHSGRMRDVLIQAGSATNANATGPSLELTGADNDSQGDGEENGWIYANLHSWGFYTQPRFMIRDQSSSNRELSFSFNSDQAEIVAKDNLKLFANNNPTNTYIRITDGAMAINIQSETGAKLQGQYDASLIAGFTAIVQGSLGAKLKVGSDEVELNTSGALDLNTVSVQNGAIDCFTSGQQVDFILPTNNPGVSYRLWSSNGVVHYTGAP